ncbi:tRNA (adenosine(37)-N6)-threonylcarbamoyltransferase complex dimerization subunit type 1 TsaB [Candidatus Peregrinibacteria bacterium]|nr:tRNA (adenosine(37)-N6)-threonylcarbamoyltransferase complex dimerization subunit type 1 TsaB [Candidatus Peregrinibacteria bacterium]
MRTLFLDIASHQGLIAAVGIDADIASKQINHRINDSELVPAIEGVVKKAGWTWEDLTRLACVCGPGGFTSLRVGVSAVNALAWGLKIPACAIHLSDLYTERAVSCQLSAVSEKTVSFSESLELKANSFIWLHSTKKTALFLRGFGTYQNLAPEAQLMNLEDALRIIPSDAPVIGELIPEHEEALGKRGLSLQKLRPVEEILPQFLAAQNYSEETIQPWYGRGI